MATPDDPTTPTFGLALRGYDRAAVDAHVAEAARRIAELSEEVTRLHEAVAAAERQRVGSSERAVELLRSADPQLLTAAQREAKRIIDDAQHQAATIEERARQEFAWRRRRVREEQTLVDLRKQQIVHQIATLTALATRAAVEPESSSAEPVVSVAS